MKKKIISIISLWGSGGQKTLNIRVLSNSNIGACKLSGYGNGREAPIAVRESYSETSWAISRFRHSVPYRPHTLSWIMLKFRQLFEIILMWIRMQFENFSSAIFRNIGDKTDNSSPVKTAWLGTWRLRWNAPNKMLFWQDSRELHYIQGARFKRMWNKHLHTESNKAWLDFIMTWKAWLQSKP